jgi:hypothetical protein
MTVTDDEERQRQGWKAIHERLRRSLVFIIDGPPGEDKAGRYHGSGTVVRSPGGVVIIVTAAHVFTDPPDGYTLGGYELEPVGDPFMTVIKHPASDEVDFAIAVLKPEIAERCGRDAISLDEIAPSDFALEIPQKEPIVLCGFPLDRRVQQVDHEKRIKFQGYVPWAYATSVLRIDRRGRYEVAWTEGIAEDDEYGLLEVYGFKVGEVFKQGHPQGISGGPLWLVRGVKKSAVWVAERAALLIGINESWDKEATEYCPSTRMWGDWVRTTIAALDAEYASSTDSGRRL